MGAIRSRFLATGGVAIFFMMLAACNGGGGGSTGTGGNTGGNGPDPQVLATFVGTYTGSVTGNCSVVPITQALDFSITQDADGSSFMWISGSNLQLSTSGSSATLPGPYDITVPDGFGGTITFSLANGVFSLSGDALSGTIDYTSNYVACPSGSLNYGGTRAVAVTLPADPTVLNVGSATSSSLVLTWSDNASDEWGYIISRQGPADPGYVEIRRVGANVAAYTDTGLAANTMYNYSVTAYNNVGESGAVMNSGTTTP